LNRRRFSASTEARRDGGVIDRTVVDSAAPVYWRSRTFHKLELFALQKDMGQVSPSRLA
jgi:hypothetical protein